VGVSRDCPIFRILPIISGTGKATNFKFCAYIYRLNRKKKRIKNFEKSSHERSQDSRKFAGHPYVGRIARSSLRQLSFLVVHWYKLSKVACIEYGWKRSNSRCLQLMALFIENFVIFVVCDVLVSFIFYVV